MMSRLKMFLTVKLPFALPHIFSGLRIGVTLVRCLAEPLRRARNSK